MNPVAPNEYPLRLSTGEFLDLSEIDLSVLEAPSSVMAAAAGVLSLCTTVTREEMEQAKAGYDSPMKAKMKAPPPGCLVKNASPVCDLMKSCSMASPQCTTKNVSRKGGKFPPCWTYAVQGLAGMERSWAAELCDAVVHAWRAGRHVVLVDG